MPWVPTSCVMYSGRGYLAQRTVRVLWRRGEGGSRDCSKCFGVPWGLISLHEKFEDALWRGDTGEHLDFTHRPSVDANGAERLLKAAVVKEKKKERPTWMDPTELLTRAARTNLLSLSISSSVSIDRFGTRGKMFGTGQGAKQTTKKPTWWATVLVCWKFVD